MLLNEDPLSDDFLIKAIEDECLVLPEEKICHSCLISNREIWHRPEICSVAQLDSAVVEKVLSLKPEIFFLGTGSKIIFPDPDLLRPLLDAQIGVEVMDTHAAARTYDVVVAEGRQAAAFFVIDKNCPE
jgi:uncharacterized protein